MSFTDLRAFTVIYTSLTLIRLGGYTYMQRMKKQITDH